MKKLLAEQGVQVTGEVRMAGVPVKMNNKASKMQPSESLLVSADGL
ncbi:hypothetical protein LJK88_01165 [Paenibacillus sp. P26]|nr:hypothetical protein LJK88_01165 [Paenibacillus sp. P26]